MGQQVLFKIESLCRSIAGPLKIVAACLSGVGGHQGLAADNLVLVILEGFSRGVKISRHKLDDFAIRVLQVDRPLFEDDIEDATLGELAAGRLLLPYTPIINSSYLEEKEVRLKKGVIIGSLENLVLEYSNLASEILIEPRYFMFAEVLRGLKIYPAMWRGFFELVYGKRQNRYLSQAETGYRAALKELESEGKINFLGDLVRVREDYVNQLLKKRFTSVPFIGSIRRALRSQIFRGYAEVASPFELARGLMSGVGLGMETPKMMEDETLDPKRFLVMPSKNGFVRLCDATSIEEYIERERAFSNQSVEIKKLGGVLNNVYLLSFRGDGATRMVVAKKFEEWTDLKWIPLAMWTIGTQNLSVRAKSRLARECAANLYLRKHGFAASAVLQVSWKKSLLFKEFIDGQRLDELIKGLIRTDIVTESMQSILWRTGKVLAEVHNTGFTIGDNKPENMIVHQDGRVFFVDLEQAGKGGNQVWDLAEFLYYSGHYVLPTDSKRGVVEVASNFAQGYIAGGGSGECLGKVTASRYVNKFVPFVLPGVLLEIRKALMMSC